VEAAVALAMLDLAVVRLMAVAQELDVPEQELVVYQVVQEPKAVVAAARQEVVLAVRVMHREAKAEMDL
jgi:hypothetical protein